MGKEYFITALKKAVVEAIINAKRTRLLYRPTHIKFGEHNPIFLAHINSYHDLAIGDKVSFDTVVLPRWLWLPSNDFIETKIELETYLKTIKECYVAGFFEVTGHTSHCAIQIKDIFCALTKTEPFACYNVLRTGSDKKDPILLFWTEGLLKIEA